MSVRRRASVVAVVVLIAANVVGAAAYFGRRPTEATHSATPEVTAATPSWRLETGSGALEPRGRPAVRHRDTPQTIEAAADDAAEIVTPEVLREANRSPCSPAPDAWVDVRQFGAKGNGKADDTEAIQKANDAVAKRGGGRVLFSPGLYKAIGVQQDSCVEFASSSGARLVHPDGTDPTAIIESRVESSTASIAKNSRILNVGRLSGMRPGAIVAVQAAGGRSAVQRTELASAVARHVNTVTVKDTKGLQREWTNHLYIENEIISYRGISGNTLLNVKRGLFGTKSEPHQAGRIVAQAQRLYAIVVRVTANRVTLDRLSSFRVEDADVKVGALGMSVVGLILNGNRQAGGSEKASPVSIRYQLARFASIRDSTLKNGAHGGIAFEMGTSDSAIEGNNFIDNGDTWTYGGSSVWLYRGATHNVVRGNTISGTTFTGITIDDRSVQSTEYDAEGQRNIVQDNTISLPRLPGPRNAGVVIYGSSGNTVIDNHISNARTGVLVAQVAQGPVPSVARANSVRNNTLFNHQVGINVSGSDNEFIRNEIRDAQRPWSNTGKRNRFVDNTIV